MKIKTLLSLIFVVSLLTVTAQAQDPGVPDTIIFVVAQGPDANAGQMHVQIDAYVYSDETLVGASGGYYWDNPFMQMDSAVKAPLFDNGFDLIASVYEDDDINTTNANQRFVLGGASLFSNIPGDAGGRRLWASYYFTLSNWTVNDSIVIDSLTFSAGTSWLMVADGQITFEPIWGGKLVIYDPNRPSGANLVVTPQVLNFTAVEGGANPDSQTFAISSDGESLDFALFKTAGWLALSPTAGMTDAEVTVSVDISGLGAGSYLDTIVINSEGAQNAPQYVVVNLTVTAAPKYLAVTPDTLYFNAVEGGANPDTASFTVSETGGGAISFTLTIDTGWVHLSAYDGTTPQNIVVFIDISGMTAGDYFDSVLVASGEAENSPIFEYISLSVAPPENNPPVLDSIGPKVTNEMEELAFTVTASDPDGTIPALSAVNLPDGANFTDSANGTGFFSWTPTYDQAGTYYVTFIASDGSLADSEVVEIVVGNVNRPPEVVQPPDTTIDECAELVMAITATDPDGDSLVMTMEPLTANMAFVDSGNGLGVFVFTPDTTQAGVYPLNVYVFDGIDTTIVMFTVTVEECEIPPECVDMILSDTVFYFVDTLGGWDKNGSAAEAQELDITSSGDNFCFIIYPYTDTMATWLTLSDTAGCTPATITLMANGQGMEAGTYQNTFAVLGDSTVCDPNPQFFTVILEVVDTTTPPPPGDTLTVATVPGVPGAQVVVPVEFTNSCNLSNLFVILGWDSEYLTLDSVSFADSRVADYPIIFDTIDNVMRKVVLGAANDGTVDNVTPGTGNFANMYFSIDMNAIPGFYEIDLYTLIGNATVPPLGNPTFVIDCGEGEEAIVPEFIPGGVVIDSVGNYVCGYVVDPDGNPIPGATVELWADFPYGAAEMTTASDSTGAFAFADFTVVPFDLYAYHEGYYPGLVEELNFGENGIMIVLTPVEDVYPTNEWVNFYCDANTYMGEPLPVGSVIDAYDPDGVHCGTFYVTEAGKYGFMPVYRDDPYMDGDQGAEPGDIITFYVNGVEALPSGDRTWTENGDAHEVCLEAGMTITKTCDLVEGWNLVSWNVDQESDYITEALASISDCIEVVLGFEQGGLTYDPELPEFSTLWYVDHLSGYWIKTNCDVTLEITGAPVPVSTPIPVTTGWNLVSYLPDFDLPTPEALATIHDNLTVALGYDGEGLTYQPGEDPYNTLNTLSPCHGYWVKVTQDGDLVYPSAGPAVTVVQKGNQRQPLGTALLDVTPTTRWMNLYSRHLTLDGETVEAGATIAAYTLDGVKIGSFTMNSDGKFGFMPVYADDNATPTIEGVTPGEQFYLTVNGVKTKEVFTWTQTGDKVEVGALTAKTSSDETLPEGYSLHQNYPNPFNPSTNISFTMPSTGTARIEIFNILGKLVAVPFDGVAQAGLNEIVWDGKNSAGENVASGIYFYRLTADNYSETRKMTLLK